MLMKLGNLAVHTKRTIRRTDALSSLMSLFEFVEWIDYSYGKNYVRRQFEESRIPTEIPSGLDEKKIRNHGALLELSEEKLDEAYEKVSVVRDGFSAARIANKKTRTFSADEISEYATRKMYIDVDLAMRGWEIGISVREDARRS
jgi:type I restriction enzyme R subunit